MSIEAMNRVWKCSEQKGSELLLMLAIADCANDASFCWPGDEYLAGRIRMSERHTRRMLTRLEEAGELYRVRDKGRGNKTFYVVAVGLANEEVEAILIKQFKVAPLEAKLTVAEWRPKEGGRVRVEIKGDNLTPFTGESGRADLSKNSDTGGQKEDKPAQKEDTCVLPYKEHEPSWNHHESSLEPTRARRRADGVGEDWPSGEGRSKHDINTIREYVKTQRGINSVEAVARACFKDGLSDGAIDEWLGKGRLRAEKSAELQGEQDDETLERFLVCLRTKINPVSFRAWFEPITQLSRRGTLLLVGVPDETYREWINSTYFEEIEETLGELGLGGHEIEFVFPGRGG